MINDFYELFKGMINPSIKDRLSPKEANQKYTRLLKKYKQSKENKKSRTRTRSPIYSSKKRKINHIKRSVYKLNYYYNYLINYEIK